MGVAPTVVTSGLSMLHNGGGGGGRVQRFVNQWDPPVVLSADLESAPLGQKSGALGQTIRTATATNSRYDVSTLSVLFNFHINTSLFAI